MRRYRSQQATGLIFAGRNKGRRRGVPWQGMKINQVNSSWDSSWVAFLGALAGIFFAPKSGKELRSDIKEKGSEVLKDAKEIYADATAKAKEIIAEAKHHAEELKKEADGHLSEAL